MPAGGIAPGIRLSTKSSAESAIQDRRGAVNQGPGLVEINAVLAQQQEWNKMTPEVNRAFSADVPLAIEFWGVAPSLN